MPSKVKVLFFSLVGLLIISQFTNCAEFEDSASSLHYSSELCFQSGTCNQANSQNLQINLSKNNFVPDQSDSVNITGECNTGGYDNHKIIWRSVGGSGLSGFLDNGCENGKFILQVSTVGLEPGRIQQVFIQIVASVNGAEIKGPLPESVISLSK